MTPELKAILDKAGKIQALADCAGSPEEAAVAASKLQSLLLRHNLTLQDIDTSELPEYDMQDFILAESPWCKSWVSSLYFGLVEVNQCEACYYRMATPHPKMSIVGRQQNIEMVHYLYAYLVRTIKQLAKDATRRAKQEGRLMSSADSYRRAFCLGAVEAIVERLGQEKQNVQEESPTNRSLMIVEEQRVHREFEKQFPDLKVGRSPRVTNGCALAAGRQAGACIAIRPAVSTTRSARHQLG